MVSLSLSLSPNPPHPPTPRQADALGDIFFYITDRLLVPYTCRNAPVGKVPFMCKGFQKRLQTNDQVYTKLIVEVDGTFGNCKSGADSCSAYADCNPTQSTGPLMWNCDCGRNHADGGSTLGFLGASPPSSDTGLAAVHVINNNNGNQRSTDPYWSCSDALDALCPIYGSVNSCTACAAIPTHQAKLQQAGCTPNDILKSCSADYNKCLAAVTGSAGCLLPPASSSASCNACRRPFIQAHAPPSSGSLSSRLSFPVPSFSLSTPHPFTHSILLSRAHARTHARTHAHARTHNTCKYTLTHARTHSRTRARSRTHAQHTHTHTRSLTHALTHSPHITHSLSVALFLAFKVPALL